MYVNRCHVSMSTSIFGACSNTLGAETYYSLSFIFELISAWSLLIVLSFARILASSRRTSSLTTWDQKHTIIKLQSSSNEDKDEWTVEVLYGDLD